MKALLILISLVTTTAAFADLRDGDVARLDYHPVSVYQITSVSRRIVPQTVSGETFYTARLRFHLVVEGNTCGGSRLTLGVKSDHLSESETALTLFTGTRKTPEEMFCAEYSKPTDVTVPEVLDLGDADAKTFRYDFKNLYVLLKWQNKTLTAEIHNEQ